MLLSHVVERATPKQREVINKLYHREMSKTDIAKEMLVSKAAVCGIEKRFLDSARKIFKRNGYMTISTALALFEIYCYYAS